VHLTRTAASPALAAGEAVDDPRVDAWDWADRPDTQEQAAASIRRSLRCAELAQAGYLDTGEAVRGLSHALLLADVDRSTALRMAHTWLGRHIPSGKPGWGQVDDAESWRQRVAGPDGSDEDRSWLAWGLALAVAELSARTLPWGPPAGSLVEMLVAEGYDPSPWERRELRRCRSGSDGA